MLKFDFMFTTLFISVRLLSLCAIYRRTVSQIQIPITIIIAHNSTCSYFWFEVNLTNIYSLTFCSQDWCTNANVSIVSHEEMNICKNHITSDCGILLHEMASVSHCVGVFSRLRMVYSPTFPLSSFFSWWLCLGISLAYSPLSSSSLSHFLSPCMFSRLHFPMITISVLWYYYILLRT